MSGVDHAWFTLLPLVPPLQFPPLFICNLIFWVPFVLGGHTLSCFKLSMANVQCWIQPGPPAPLSSDWALLLCFFGGYTQAIFRAQSRLGMQEKRTPTALPLPCTATLPRLIGGRAIVKVLSYSAEAWVQPQAWRDTSSNCSPVLSTIGTELGSGAFAT